MRRPRNDLVESLLLRSQLGSELCHPFTQIPGMGEFRLIGATTFRACRHRGTVRITPGGED